MLDDLRRTLIRQEETVIFALIERAQFKHNPVIYEPGGIPLADPDASFLSYFLHRTEEVHALTRRYTDPCEHPFSDDLPKPILDAMPWNAPIVRNAINVNPTILDYYVNQIVPGICDAGDCGNYGASACCDVHCLQTLSKRIHYGKFIAEAKFRANTDLYSDLIRADDSDAIMDLLVDKEVEANVLRRVWKKAAAYGCDPDSDDAVPKVLPDVIVDVYREFLIPLTCEVEVEYLLRRLDAE